MVWAKNGTPHTLTGVASIVQITDVITSKFNVVLVNYINSGAVATGFRISSDTGTNYSHRRSIDGAADGTTINNDSINSMNESSHSYPVFAIHYVIDISGQEKLVIANAVRQETAGAGTAPSRQESVGKHVTTAVISAYSVNESAAGDYTTDSNMSALGTD